jgi:hypothetical protein
VWRRTIYSYSNSEGKYFYKFVRKGGDGVGVFEL